MVVLMVPFVIFNSFLEWIQNRSEFNAIKEKAQTWMTKTTTITRKGRKNPIIWNPAISLAMVRSIIST
jgi:hypothetical protein